MPYLVMHFEAEQTADLNSVALALGAKTSKLPDVERAVARAEPLRDGGATEVLLIISVPIELIKNAGELEDALKHLIDSAKGLGESLGLRKPRAEIGMRQVPHDKLTPEDLREWAEE